MRATPQAAIDFVSAKEACKLTSYPDVGGIWTVGYGHTGPDIKSGLTITQDQANAYLRQDLDVAARRLDGVVTEDVIQVLTDNQYAALLSFVFNLGADKKWQIWKTLNGRDFDHVPEQIMRFCYAGGKKVQGLVNRRAAEVQLWSTEEPGCANYEPSSAAMRSAETPPLPAKGASLGHILAVGVAAVGGVAKGAQSVTDLIQPFADKSNLVQHALSYAATAGAFAAVAVGFLVWLQSKRAAQ